MGGGYGGGAPPARPTRFLPGSRRPVGYLSISLRAAPPPAFGLPRPTLLCFSLTRGPDHPKQGASQTARNKRKPFYYTHFFPTKEREIIFQGAARAGTDRFTGSEPETPRSPLPPAPAGAGGRRRSSTRRKGALGAPEKKRKLLEAA